MDQNKDMKTVVLGLGNPILCDDSVGIRIARELENRIPSIDAVEAAAAGFRVMDQIIGYERLVMIDSVKTGTQQPGYLHEFSVDQFRTEVHLTSPHDMNFFDALAVYKKRGEKVPSVIEIFGIEVSRTDIFSETCTDSVEAAIPGITENICNRILNPKS